MDAIIHPQGSLEVLSRDEMRRLVGSGGESPLQTIFRKCALAVLNSGSPDDDAREVYRRHADFRISVIQLDRGIQLAVKNAPDAAFVDGEMIHGMRELLFTVLRDIVFMGTELEHLEPLGSAEQVTDAVFYVLRNARVLHPERDPRLVVCWGGHAISREEYDYSKQVGYELGLRGLDVCTGCGAGAMKGPMKGATIGHAKQRIRNGRYLGVSEPGIIAAESPNPIVNELVVMPDMEKRLEAFVRLGHGIVIFPGGVGTAEEVLFLLGILLHPENVDQPFPLVFTAPEGSRDYLARLDAFLAGTLGPAVRQRYRIFIDDSAGAARYMAAGIQEVKAFRHDRKDAHYFNWRLKIGADFTRPFQVSHESMAALNLSSGLQAGELAVQLRRAFSGIVAGNVREDGIRMVEQEGPFELRGDTEIIERLGSLLMGFVEERRMKLAGREYRPCFRVVGN